MQTKLAEALITDYGPVDVAKIEIEILPNQRFRWIVWGADGRIYSATAAADGIPPMLAATAAIVETGLKMTPIEPYEPLQGAPSRDEQEKILLQAIVDQVPGAEDIYREWLREQLEEEQHGEA